MGGQAGNIMQDSGPDRGQQSIQHGGVVAKVIVVNGNAYIQGNSPALTGYFGFPAADGPSFAGHWISISPSDSSYATVSAGVSLLSVINEIGLAGNLAESPRTIRQGQTVIGVSGTASFPDMGGASATLYVTPTVYPLPVEFDTTSSEGAQQIVFSAWGKAIFLSAPSKALPITSITH
jgi:hypothetical protein